MLRALVRSAGVLAVAAPLAFTPARAQEAAGGGAAAATDPREDVTFDVVRLFGVEGKTLVEIYSRIPTAVLAFQEADGRWEATLDFALAVRRGDEVVLEDSWTRTKTIGDRALLESSHGYFVETHAFLVTPGSYRLEGAIRDASGRELGRLDRTLEAPEENPPASDLLLASRILPDTAEAEPEGYDPLRKNRLVLNPNPGQVYSTGASPLVFFYLEFENVEDQPLPLERVLRFRAAGSEEVVKELRAAKTYQPGWTIDFGAVNVAGLPAGSYSLEVSWEAPAGGELPEPYQGLTRRENLVVVREARPTMAADAAAATATAPAAGEPATSVRDWYPNFTEAELDSVFVLLDVFFKDREEDIYDGLSVEGKRNFLNAFWARQDPTPGTPENAFREEIDERLTHIENNFRSPGQQGWETPRGRIYLKNGRPDRRVERVLETGFAAPYEIWIYYTTGYKYVFLDEFRNRRYILLTTTDPEEEGRPDWQERLPVEAVQEIIRE
ncbi:MAG TPA: GWxTD domain-containing protein [Gemmatimonadota bacterium]|jgi:GWxTD domain-containing protein